MVDRRALAPRRGLVGSPLVVAALVAAHGAAGAAHGFRMTDVRFFFFLFSNWLELDLLRATEPLELTQVRRVLARLLARRWARKLPAKRFVLTPTGLAELVAELASEEAPRSFEESLFLACFARCYSAAILARAPAARRRALRALLSTERLLGAAERRAERMAADLDERVRTSLAMQDEARALRRGGLPPSALAAALDRRDAYQLQHVRSYAEVVRALPADLLAFEVEEGIGARSELLFEPLVKLARAQRGILAALRAALAQGPQKATR
jgi:hypothetical protein